MPNRDLVTRLRDYEACNDNDIDEAADRLEELLAQKAARTRQLQRITGQFASYLGHTEGLFGMTLAGIHWGDGTDYLYWPDKRIEDFTEQECLDTLQHVHEWLQATNIHTKYYVPKTPDEESK